MKHYHEVKHFFSVLKPLTSLINVIDRQLFSTLLVFNRPTQRYTTREVYKYRKDILKSLGVVQAMFKIKHASFLKKEKNKTAGKKTKILQL